MSAIIGWAHSKFGKLEDMELETLLATISRDAVEDAGIGFEDIDAIYVGNFGMFEKQSFPAAFTLDADPHSASSQPPGSRMPVRPVRRRCTWASMILRPASRASCWWLARRR
jgi:hypothetical protein